MIAPWTPFVCAAFPPLTEEETLRQMEITGFTRERVIEFDAEKRSAEAFVNSRYQVLKIEIPAQRMIHLKIVRLDREAVGTERYRDFMRIKDELVGAEHEAVEIYPPRSCELDTINMYHLWVFACDIDRLPFGYHAGRAVYEPRPNSGELKQRAFEH